MHGDVSPEFLNPRRDIDTTQNRLPHWEQDNCTYFLTYRLADALPQKLLRAWKEERRIWLGLHPKPWSPEQARDYQERFPARQESWLDAMHGSCVLKSSLIRKIVQDNLQKTTPTVHFWSYVIMPNHVHLLCSFPNLESLGQYIKNWKGGSAFQINRAIGKSGALWHKDYFDRLIRNETHFMNCAHYIRKNPIRAQLTTEQYTLVETQYVIERLALP